MTHRTKLLIRADAGPAVGTGHVMRMLALGQAWVKQGGEVVFVCGELPSSLTKRLEQRFQLSNVSGKAGSSEDAQQTLELAQAFQPDWITLDGYRFDDPFQEIVKRSNIPLFVMDDYRHASHQHADFVLNQNSYASADDYDRHDNSQMLLVGPKYLLLREEFVGAHESRSVARKNSNDVRKILVTFGGSDPDNWTLKTLQVLSDLKRRRLTVDCVVGACYEHFAELEMFKKTCSLNVRIHQYVEQMTSLMSKTDLAITAGGSTCYELARCGVPSIVVAIADNQLAIANWMHENGIMLSIDENEPEPLAGSGKNTCRETRLINAIRQMICDVERRQKMSQKGMTIVDGKGAQRVVDKMGTQLVSFRTATQDDAEWMWHWRNDPEVRSVSFNKAVVPLEQHRTWLDTRLEDERSLIWMSDDRHGSPVGQVRFDLGDHGESAQISIIVNQALRGRGLGTKLISAACDKLFASSSHSALNQIIAQIMPTNTASEKAFRAAGFRAIEPTVVNGIMALQFVLERPSQLTSPQSTLRKSA